MILLKILSKQNKNLNPLEKVLFYLRGNSQPFSGTVEKNSTDRLSVDEYNAGLLEGKSIRKSVDGSGLRPITGRETSRQNDFL